jgi:hypothetical protein
MDSPPAYDAPTTQGHQAMKILIAGLLLAAISLLPFTGWQLGRAAQATATVVYLPTPATPAACFGHADWGI